MPSSLSTESLSSDPSLQWVQVSPGRYERAIDDMEQFYLLQESLGAGQTGAQNWMVSAGIKLEGNLPNFAEDAKRAWTTLRYRYPAIAAKFEGTRCVYNVADHAELQSWLEETYIVHKDTSNTSRELYSTTPRLIRRVVLHILPQTQEILIQAPHTHLDGRGFTVLVNNLLDAMVSPEEATFGAEAERLLPPLTLVANIPPCSPEQRSKWHETTQAWLDAMPTVQLRTSTADAPSNTAMQYMQFSADETQQILAAAKQYKLSMGGVGQAAVSRAARAHGGCHDVSSVATIALYDAREYASNESDVPLLGPHTVANPILVPLGSTFVDTARNSQEAFVAGKKDDWALKMSGVYAREFPLRLMAPPPPGKAPPAPSNAHLTSLGRLDAFLQSELANGVRVADPWLVLDLATPDVLVATWSYGGRLTFELGYNEAFHNDESMREYLGLISNQLSDGLGVELSPSFIKPGEQRRK